MNMGAMCLHWRTDILDELFYVISSRVEAGDNVDLVGLALGGRHPEFSRVFPYHLSEMSCNCVSLFRD